MNHKSNLWVNPGRPPTKLGGDGILPYLQVPHWLSAQIAKVLEQHKIEFTLQHAVSGTPGPTPGTLHPEHHDDRFTFPRAKASAVQAVMDSIRPPPPFGGNWPGRP